MNGCVKAALEIAKYTTDKITRMLERVLNEMQSTTATVGLYPYTTSERRVPLRMCVRLSGPKDPYTIIVSKEPCNGTVKFDYDSCTTTRDSSDAKFNDASSSSP